MTKWVELPIASFKEKMRLGPNLQNPRLVVLPVNIIKEKIGP